MERASVLRSGGTHPPPLCKILRRTLHVSCYFAKTNVAQMATGYSCMGLAAWFSFFQRTKPLCAHFPLSEAPGLAGWHLLSPAEWRAAAAGEWGQREEELTIFHSRNSISSCAPHRLVEQDQNVYPDPRRGRGEKGGFSQEWKHIPKMRSED